MPGPLQQARPTDPYLRWEPYAQPVRDSVVDGDQVAWTDAGTTSGQVCATASADDATVWLQTCVGNAPATAVASP